MGINPPQHTRQPILIGNKATAIFRFQFPDHCFLYLVDKNIKM